ncbi:MAG: hypothetical protein H8E27_00685 [Verrucomicrobia subdivision 3 bacterium]|nr:hypothetical protein [Limisphaerales bacterium]
MPILAISRLGAMGPKAIKAIPHIKKFTTIRHSTLVSGRAKMAILKIESQEGGSSVGPSGNAKG